MRAYVTSIGEPTTEICVWSLERSGFDVTLVKDSSSLWSKLKFIYHDTDEDFLRIDADTIPNRNIQILENPVEAWWVQYTHFEWYRQDVGYGGVQFIKKEALEALRANVDRFRDLDRPETELSRIKEFYEPRRFISSDRIMGVHNYRNNLKRVRGVKANRGQSSSYDWELAERLESL